MNNVPCASQLNNWHVLFINPKANVLSLLVEYVLVQEQAIGVGPAPTNAYFGGYSPPPPVGQAQHVSYMGVPSRAIPGRAVRSCQGETCSETESGKSELELMSAWLPCS